MKYLLHGQFHQEVLQSSHLQLKTKFIIHFFKKQTTETLLLFLLLASGDGVAIHPDLHLFAQAGDLTVPTDTFEQSLSPVHSPQHPSPVLDSLPCLALHHLSESLRSGLLVGLRPQLLPSQFFITPATRKALCHGQLPA